jgi:hypothetical protein
MPGKSWLSSQSWLFAPENGALATPSAAACSATAFGGGARAAGQN